MQTNAKTSNITCNVCYKDYTSQSTLNRHIRLKHSSVETTNEMKQCIWCKNRYDNIKIHLKRCKEDKDSIHSHTLGILELKEKEIEELKKQRDDLQYNLFKLADKTTNTINTTYNNTILNCDKPLILDKEYVQEKLNEYCGISFLKRGGEGMCDWFLESVCTNDSGNLCIECVDKNRKRFKFEDENEKMNEISGKEIVDLIKSCFPNFKSTLHYKSFLQEIEELCNRNYSPEESSLRKYEYLKKLEFMHTDFVNRLVDKTHKDSFRSLLKNNITV
jgi:hypothetical protein